MLNKLWDTLKSMFVAAITPDGRRLSEEETIPLPEEITAGDPLVMAHARLSDARQERIEAAIAWSKARAAKKKSSHFHAEYVRLTNEVLALKALIKRGGE